MHAKGVTHVIVLWALTANLAQAASLGTAFNYQGRLSDGDHPANGYYDLRFSLHSSLTNDSQVGNTLTNDHVGVSNGLFAVSLDFGAGLFDGTAYWLEVAVRTNDPTASFTPLEPRQPLAAMPYALYAPSAGTAASALSLSGTLLESQLPASIPRLDALGRLADAHLSSNVALLNGSAVFAGAITASSFNGDGAALSNLNSASLTGPISVQTTSRDGHISDGGFVRSVAVSGRYVYVADELNGLLIYDISNPAMPSRVSQINNGGHGWSVVVSGNYAYLANFEDGVRIYDISYLPYFLLNVGHINNGSAAGGVAVSGHYAYVASYDDGLRIYNVADPAHPVSVGHTKNDDVALGVVASGDYAYVASGTNGLRIYSVADPTNPVPVAQLSASGMANGVTVVGRYAYLANGDDGLRIYDILDPPTAFPVGHIDEGGIALNVVVDGGYAYLANAHDGLRIYDVSNPTNPIPVRHINEACCAYGVAVSGNTVCVANGSDGLRLIPQTTNQQAWRLELTGWAPNIIGGFSGNSVEFGAVGVTIGGGELNAVSMSSAYTSIGGGLGNKVGFPEPYAGRAYGNFSTIAGGAWNEISLVDYLGPFFPFESATIGGGVSNLVQSGRSTIGGGSGNTVGAPASVISGGEGNSIVNHVIRPLGSHATIGGGFHNEISGDQAGGRSVTIGGGEGNILHASDGATIGGGFANQIFHAHGATIGGGARNRIDHGFNYFVPCFSTISGGAGNVILPDVTYSSIGGGSGNTMSNANHMTICGGESNVANGAYATIPGGQHNLAASYSFAAGRRAKANHTGAFVWADATNEDVASTGTNQFLIRASGGVGIGTARPVTMLDVFDGTGPAGQGGSIHVGGTAKNGDPKMIYFGDMPYVAVGENNADDQMELRAGTFFFTSIPGTNGDGFVGIGTNEPASALHVVGTITTTSVNQTSDRAAKEHFASVDGRDVLDKVAQLPIESWNFKDETQTRHLGPMAQDFYAAFGLGTDDKHIAAVDAEGVALAAIQGLNQKLEEELKRKDAEIQLLQQRLAAVAELVNKLAAAKD